MKVVILCGGRGIRLNQEASFIPKAMIRIGHQPMIWHIMKRYALYGHTEFVLALGTKGEMLRDYFTRYDTYTNDMKVQLGSGKLTELGQHQEGDWGVSLIDTGEQAFSGARIARCKNYLTDDIFLLTYSDCVANIDIDKLIAFHKKSGKIVTVTGVMPPFREGDFIVQRGLATGLYDPRHTRDTHQHLINGGFMVFSKKSFSYLSSFNECKLETDIFLKLIADKQLAIYQHSGFWKWLDTDRDYRYLQDLVDKNNVYWLQEGGGEK